MRMLYNIHDWRSCSTFDYFFFTFGNRPLTTVRSCGNANATQMQGFKSQSPNDLWKLSPFGFFQPTVGTSNAEVLNVWRNWKKTALITHAGQSILSLPSRWKLESLSPWNIANSRYCKHGKLPFAACQTCHYNQRRKGEGREEGRFQEEEEEGSISNFELVPRTKEEEEEEKQRLRDIWSLLLPSGLLYGNFRARKKEKNY